MVEQKAWRAGVLFDQVLTGHGNFRAYLHRFHLSPKEQCLGCGAETDDPEHKIFHCDRWFREREELVVEFGLLFLPESMLDAQRKAAGRSLRALSGKS